MICKDADVFALKQFSKLALELLGADIHVGVVDAVVEDGELDEVGHVLLLLHITIKL